MADTKQQAPDLPVYLFTGFLEAGKTQFIVITHRRGTMEEADVLYGITMQERGVSTVLTANLNELSKEMKIK